MSIAMMLPSTFPLVRVFLTITQGSSGLLALLCVGYLLMWALFGAMALLADAGLHRLAEGSAWLASRPGRLAGILLLGAGLFQFSLLLGLDAPDVRGRRRPISAGCWRWPWSCSSRRRSRGAVRSPSRWASCWRRGGWGSCSASPGCPDRSDLVGLGRREGAPASGGGRPPRRFVTRQIVSLDGQIGSASRVAAQKIGLDHPPGRRFPGAFVGMRLACPPHGAPGTRGRPTSVWERPCSRDQASGRFERAGRGRGYRPRWPRAWAVREDLPPGPPGGATSSPASRW